MKYLLSIVAAGIILQLGCGAAGDQLTFRAKAVDIQHKSNSLLKGKQADDFVDVTLPGKLFHPAQPVQQVSRTQADWSTPERAAASIFSANSAGDVPWIVENYVPAERESISKRLADPLVREQARNFYGDAGKVSLLARTELRGYTVLFLQGMDPDGDATVISITLSKTPEGWKQTDALSRDDTFEIVWTAFHTGGVS